MVLQEMCLYGFVNGDATICGSEMCLCNRSVIVIRRAGIYCFDKHVEYLTFRLLMSYIYGAPILDVSRSHTTTQHSR